MAIGRRGKRDKTSNESAEPDDVDDISVTNGNTSEDEPPSDSNSHQASTSESRNQQPSQVQLRLENIRQSNNIFVEAILKRKNEIDPEKAQDYYTLLGVDPNATEKEISKVYKRLAIRLHPDQNSHKDAAEAFRHIKEVLDEMKENAKIKEVERLLEEDFKLETRKQEALLREQAEIKKAMEEAEQEKKQAISDKTIFTAQGMSETIQDLTKATNIANKQRRKIDEDNGNSSVEFQTSCEDSASSESESENENEEKKSLSLTRLMILNSLSQKTKVFSQKMKQWNLSKLYISNAGSWILIIYICYQKTGSNVSITGLSKLIY